MKCREVSINLKWNKDCNTKKCLFSPLMTIKECTTNKIWVWVYWFVIYIKQWKPWEQNAFIIQYINMPFKSSRPERQPQHHQQQNPSYQVLLQGSSHPWETTFLVHRWYLVLQNEVIINCNDDYCYIIWNEKILVHGKYKKNSDLVFTILDYSTVVWCILSLNAEGFSKGHQY